MKSPKDFLIEELAQRKRVNPLYSLRAFARQLRLSPGELSEIISGKRHLSLKSALRISKSLGLNQAETKYLLQIAQLEKSRDVVDQELRRPLENQRIAQQLGNDVFHIVADWYCFAILNLAECAGFKWNFNFIAKRLGISVHEARLGVERLERVGLIENKKGKRRLVKDFVIAGSGVPSEAIRNYHRQMLSKSREALDFQSVEERDVRGLSMAIDRALIPAVKDDIKNFLNELAAKYAHCHKTDVYHVEVAFFNLTKPDHEETK